MTEEKAAVSTAPAEAPEAAAAASKPKGKGGAPGVRLHVKNLGNDMTSDQLKELFAAHGSVKSGAVMTTEDGKCKGFGFVVMSTADEATKAIAEVNGKKHGENELSVILAPDKKDKGKGKGDSDGKGKGKGDKGKGKGANQGSPPADPYSQYGMNPYDPAMMQAYAMQAMQMQQMQQMYMMQAALQMYGLPPPATPQPETATQSNDKGKGQGKGKKGKGKGKPQKDEAPKNLPPPPPADKVFVGTLKSHNPTHGYGFIVCPETKEYNRDVWVSSDSCPKDIKVGDSVKFNLTVSEKGHPRALNVARAS